MPTPKDANAFSLWLDGKLVSIQELNTATRDEQELGIHQNIGYRPPWDRVVLQSKEGR